MSDANITLGLDLKLSELIDKLSEKLGVATDKLEPIAKEGLNQYALRETVLTVAHFALVLLFVLGIYIGYKIAKTSPKPKSAEDIPGGIIFGVLVCFGSLIGFIITLVSALCHLGNAVAPLPSILGL
jgi:hypothetical protein